MKKEKKIRSHEDKQKRNRKIRFLVGGGLCVVCVAVVGLISETVSKNKSEKSINNNEDKNNYASFEPNKKYLLKSISKRNTNNNWESGNSYQFRIIAPREVASIPRTDSNFGIYLKNSSTSQIYKSFFNKSVNSAALEGKGQYYELYQNMNISETISSLQNTKMKLGVATHNAIYTSNNPVLSDHYLKNFKGVPEILAYLQNSIKEFSNQYQGISHVVKKIDWASSYYKRPDTNNDYLRIDNVWTGIDEIFVDIFLSEYRAPDVESMKSTFLKNFKNNYNIDSDTGFGNGIYENNPLNIPGAISNLDKLDLILKNNWNTTKAQNPIFNKYDIGANFKRTITSKDKMNLSIIIKALNGTNGQDIEIPVLNGINLSFSYSYLFNNFISSTSIKTRLIINPGFSFKFKNEKYIYSLDEPTVVAGGTPETEDGKISIYHAPLSISFRTTLLEDEVLFINNVAVDVKDLLFEMNLEDYISKNINPETGEETEERINEYVLKVEKYNQVNGVNTSIKLTYTNTIVIESTPDNFEVSYFAWDPSKNPSQLNLISPYLIDGAGEPILDKEGNKIDNPNFDPLIDPSTGTKKQLIWVKNRKIDKKYLSFIPDPIDENGNIIFDKVSGVINQDKVGGFLAEAIVIPKGIKITNSNGLFGERFSVAFLENNNVGITQPRDAYYGNENTYFSQSGVYFTSDNRNENLSTVKVIGFGKGDATGLFTDYYQDNSEYGWVDFWTSYQGIHLKNYLKEYKFLNDADIFQFGYQQILHYWKVYCSFMVSNILDGIDKIINPKLKIDSIKQYASTIERGNFNPSEELKKSWWDKFELSEYVNMNIFESNGELEVLWSLKESVIDGNLIIIPTRQIINVKWLNDKEDPDEGGKTKLNINIDQQYIKKTISSYSEKDFINNPNVFDKNKMFLENKERLEYNVELTNDWIIINFFPVDQSKYFVSPEDNKAFFEKLFDGNNTLINIFADFKFDFLNLNGWNTVEKIKEAIKAFVLENVRDIFILDLDYKIDFPSKEELKKLTIINSDLEANPFKAIIKLRVLPTANPKYYGSKNIEVFNKAGDGITPNENDLSKLKLNNINVEFDNLELLQIDVFNQIQNQLNTYNLKLNIHVQIIDFNLIMSSLFQQIGSNSVVVKIVPKINGIINFATIKITNLTTKVIPFDLSQIILGDLNFQLTNRNEILSKIKIFITENIYDKFNLKEKDLKIGFLNEEEKLISFDSLEFLRSLVEKNPPSWAIIKQILVISNSESLINQTFFMVKNISGDSPYDPDLDNDWDTDADSNIGAVIGYTALISVAIIGLVVITIISTKIIIRKKSKKIN